MASMYISQFSFALHRIFLVLLKAYSIELHHFCSFTESRGLSRMLGSPRVSVIAATKPYP